jgi:hypothetical protein
MYRGCQPFNEADFNGVLHLLRSVENGLRPPIPPDCPDYISKLMHRCWHDDPAARISATDILRHMTRSSGDYSAQLYPNGVPRSSEDLQKSNHALSDAQQKPTGGQNTKTKKGRLSNSSNGGGRKSTMDESERSVEMLSPSSGSVTNPTAALRESIIEATRHSALLAGDIGLDSEAATESYTQAGIDYPVRDAHNPGRLSTYSSRQETSESVTSI